MIGMYRNDSAIANDTRNREREDLTLIDPVKYARTNCIIIAT